MNETLEAIMVVGGGTLGVMGGIGLLTNTGQFVNALYHYLPLKKSNPDNYRELIQEHYDRMKDRAQGYFADQKFLALPGISLAKYIASK